MAAMRSLWRQSTSCTLRRCHTKIQMISAARLAETEMIGIRRARMGIDMITTSLSAGQYLQDPIELGAMPGDDIAGYRTDHGGKQGIVHRTVLASSFLRVT